MAIEVLALITARGGSKGVPRKNVLPVGGKPLIAWSILAALESRYLDRVVVSTDDSEIAEVARTWGAEVPFMRPAELAGDTSDHISVVLHALDWCAQHENRHYDYLLLLQPTSPLRITADIDACIELASERRSGAVVSLKEVGEHPYFLKQLTSDGVLADFMPEIAALGYLGRQQVPTVYYPDGVAYLTRTDVLREARTFFPEDTLPYFTPPERTLDIDTAWDLHLADLILRAR